MKIALAQLNPTVGAVRSNATLASDAAHVAAASGAELIIVPELLLSGYPPKDLLLREGFVEACDAAVDELAGNLPDGIGMLVGHPTGRDLPDGRVANAASLLADGRIVQTIHKTLLPNYDVFDEKRYFRPSESIDCIPFGGLSLGVHICEDAWWSEPQTYYSDPANEQPDPVARLVERGADLLINLSASPYEIDKDGRRLSMFQRHVARHGVPVIFVNQVGGNDDLVFDGHSFVLDSSGRQVLDLPGFRPDVQVCDLSAFPSPAAEAETAGEVAVDREADLLEALTLGVHDYMHKCGFSDCVLGLSGGIDSAVACCIAARAVGPANVHALLMPSRYSSEHSVTDARMLAERLRIDHELIPIGEVHTAYTEAAVVGGELTADPAGLADQNLQARIRGALVMVRSNHNGWLALATGNKSELAVGYCTLYGDMAGGFAVLCDVLKRDVYAVARHINSVGGATELIPANIIDKPPSAELAPGQLDQDALPEYHVLDGILAGLIEDERSVTSLSQEFPPETVRWVASRVDRNEFKRRQMPPGIKLSSRAFGSGRRMPMAARLETDGLTP